MIRIVIRSSRFPPSSPRSWSTSCTLVKCRRCGEITAANLPEGVPNQCAGPRLQAILSLAHRPLPRDAARGARDLVIALFGEKAHGVGGNDLRTWSSVQARRSSLPTMRRWMPIQNAAFVHCDETGWWRGAQRARLALGARSRPCSRCSASTRAATAKAFRKLLFAFNGLPHHGSGSRSTGCTTLKKRQLCWAHLLRNFLGLEERGGKARSLGIAGQQDREGLVPRVVSLPRRGDHEARAPAQVETYSGAIGTAAASSRQQSGPGGAQDRQGSARVRRGTVDLRQGRGRRAHEQRRRACRAQGRALAQGVLRLA